METFGHSSKFQSTLPARGATAAVHSDFGGVRISIHAPRTGSDQSATRRAGAGVYFNPRSPHGERLDKSGCRCFCGYFNPRSPHGERLQSFDRRCGRGLFQSTLPARGATLAYLVAPFAAIKFQSTLPARGATLFSPATPRWQAISIHAPRTGSDERREHLVPLTGISIHAPRTGSDCHKHMWD